MTKRKFLPTIALASVCLAVALCLAIVNMLTAPIIEAARIEAISESLRVVMPGGVFSDPEPLPEGAPESVVAIYKEKNGGGHVVALRTMKGYEGKGISITVGIDTDGKIVGAVVTENTDSLYTDKSTAYPEAFVGKLPSEAIKVDTISDVTASTTAIKNAILDALSVLGYIENAPSGGGSGLPSTDGMPEEELLALIEEKGLSRDSSALLAVENDELPPSVKRVYRDTDGGHIIYIITSTQWTPVETEALVKTDRLGNVTKLELITWTVGHGVMADEEYLESFIGKHNSSLGRVDLVSGATTTSANLRDALRGALDVLYPAPVYSIITASVLAAILAAAIGGYIAVVSHQK